MGHEELQVGCCRNKGDSCCYIVNWTEVNAKISKRPNHIVTDAMPVQCKKVDFGDSNGR